MLTNNYSDTCLLMAAKNGRLDLVKTLTSHILRLEIACCSFCSFDIVIECVCCLLVLDSVTSTPQWIRQPKPCDVVHNVCVFVRECVLGSARASQPLNIRLCLF